MTQLVWFCIGVVCCMLALVVIDVIRWYDEKDGDRMDKPLFTRCEGNGQGSCRRCELNGKWSRTWMCFLYKIEGLDGYYCRDCVDEYLRDVLRKEVDDDSDDI